MHYCPCCGYPGLDAPAYRLLGEPPFRRDLAPPYEEHFGDASYDVCDCCGFEFGNDDNPGTAPPTTFDRYLRDWLQRGAQWFDPEKRPANWDVARQLQNIGISL